MMKLEVTTALAILLPVHVAKYVDNFREVNDKAFDRWPAHINLVYPFIPESKFSELEAKLKIAFQDNLQSFTIHLDTIDYFTQSDCLTMHAKPKRTADLTKLHTIILDCLSDIVDINTMRDFQPHMTLGQFSKGADSLKQIQELKNKWGSGVSFKCSSVCMISRVTTPRFEIINQVFF